MKDLDFVTTLVAEGVETIPCTINSPQRHITEAEQRTFRRQLRERALAFLTDEALAPRVRRLLAKLNEKWRAEAAEMIILANDTSEPFVRALVVATPVLGLQRLPRKHAVGASGRRLKFMTQERDFLLRRVKPALASYGRNALDLIAVEAFARCLIARPSVVAWLELHNKDAFLILSSIHQTPI
jgi:hypothetical protein